MITETFCILEMNKINLSINCQFTNRFFFRENIYTINKDFANVGHTILWYMYIRKTHLLAQISYDNKNDKRRMIRSRIRIICAIPIWTTLLASSHVSKMVIKKSRSRWIWFIENPAVTYAIFIPVLKTKNLRYVLLWIYFFPVYFISSLSSNAPV